MKTALIATLILPIAILPQLLLMSSAIAHQPSNSTNLALDRTTVDRDRSNRIADAADGSLTPQQVQAIAQKITVRVSAINGNNGGSGVLIAQKGNTYLVMTNRHVVGRERQFQIQTTDGQKHTAQLTPNTKIDPKYDIALLQFTSTKKYTLPDLNSAGSPLDLNNPRPIYSVGYPYDSNKIRISTGKVTQLSDVPLEDGTQIGYEIDKNSPEVKQGMSGGPIVDGGGVLLGINTIGSYPILPNYTYADGSKPIAKLAARYRQANWGVPIYTLLTQLDANILYGYDNLPKVQRQVTPTGYMAKLNRETRQQTVRIETATDGNGSGVIVAKQGNTYYVLTAKHVLETPPTDDRPKQRHTGIKIITHDQESYQIQPSNIKLDEGVDGKGGVDLAIVKFTSQANYPVAKIGNYSPIGTSTVFAAGYPGREKIDSPLWQWQLNPGRIGDKEQGKLLTQDKQSFSNGYDLIYTSISYGGMSGGPVFDTDGRVIGIHGKAEATDGSLLGNSLGISIQTFIGIKDRLQVPNLTRISQNQPVDLSPADLATVAAVRNNVAKPQDESNGKQWLQYGNQLYRIGKFAEAAAVFDKAISRGREYQLLGNYGKALALWSVDEAQALKAISTAIAAVPVDKRRSYYYLWKHQGVIFRDLGKYDDALKSIDLAISLEPSDPNNPSDLTLLSEKAGILGDKKQYREAIAIYDSIIRKRSEAYAYYNRGTVKLKLGQKQAAIADFDKAIVINPNSANAYNNRGTVKSDLGQKQAAITDFDKAIAINPNYADAYYNRGTVKSKSGQKQAATTDFDKAIAINPNYADAYYNRGLIKSESGQKQAAIADFDKAIAINPNYAETYYNRGIVKSELGQKQAAFADFDKAIVINPNYAEAYTGRGLVKSELGQKQAAIADCNRAIAINPNFAETYYNRGLVKSELGQKQVAIADYGKAIAINPNFAQAYINRGVAKSELGQKQAAITDLTKAAELFRQQNRMNDYQDAIGLIQKIQR